MCKDIGNKKKNNYLLFICIIIAVILITIINVYCDRHLYMKKKIINESFTNPNIPEYTNFNKVSSYSDLELQPNTSATCNLPLLNSNKVYTPQGTPLPLHHETRITNLIESNGPSVDGTNNSPQNMFMLAYNRVSPDCCPSTFSTSGGCVCMTDNQRKFINSGGNLKCS